MIVHEWTAAASDPVQEGRAYGDVWRPQLRASLSAYLDLFAQSAIPTAVALDVADGCRLMTEEHAPEIAAEMRGMAEGSGLSLLEVYLLAARTEVLARSPQGGECSTIVDLSDPSAPPRTLQTWDWHETLSNETVVRRLTSTSGARVVTFSEFGQPAKIGVNDRGVGLHFNILHHTSDGDSAGVPVHVLARMILDRAHDLDDAIALAERTPCSASSVLTVVTFDGAVGDAASIEVAPAGVAVIRPCAHGTLVHTNHFLDPVLAAGEYAPYVSTTVERFRCLSDAAASAQLPDAFARARAFGAIPDAPITVRPRADMPAHTRWETKLTVALDVESAAVEFAARAPADVEAEDWRRVTVEERTADTAG
ncbi:C45 family autoproteolytic acyltransferase/hydrolase [Microbacterium koreense]|uniref:C45 family autoproteolytic acyltransferase/hydrolase n=1 Tax=Microbacterium koreense TaxID=323761 RepID=A0ABW2ZMH0_9MICO